jgi:hypothetical protein
MQVRPDRATIGGRRLEEILTSHQCFACAASQGGTDGIVAPGPVMGDRVRKQSGISRLAHPPAK